MRETRERELRARVSVTRAEILNKMTSGRSESVVVMVEGAMREEKRKQILEVFVF